MIYGFAKQSGGHIKIYSEVGHGTTMRLYLPRLRTAAGTSVETIPVAEAASATVMEQALEPAAEPVPSTASSSIMPPAADEAPAVRKPLVLVVEDNPSVRDVAAAMIEDMGFNVLIAANGVEGLKCIEERHDIDLVLSDVIMAGGLNGPEMALKALAVRPELKVLFMSGYAPGSLRQMQEDLPNAVDLVNKPFTRNDLTEKVKRALAA
jgi:CheY-like chemotaxis protein